MKAMTMAVSAMVLGGSLVGCPGHGVRGSLDEDIAVDPVDGRWCGEVPQPTGPVFINVTYLPDGMPQVSPLDCKVKSRTRVTWRGPDGEPVEFEVLFKATRPIEDDDRAPLVAAESDGRYRIRRTIAGPLAPYPYGVKANGKELDPAIIIDR